LWAEAFGRENLVSRIFGRDKLFNNDVIDDFASLIGLPVEEDRVRIELNPILSFEAMNALLLLNASRLRGNVELRRAIVQSGMRDPGIRIPMLSRGEAREFLAKFESSNEELFREYVDPSLPGRDTRSVARTYLGAGVRRGRRD